MDMLSVMAGGADNASDTAGTIPRDAYRGD